MQRRVRVLVADDSPTVRAFLVNAFNAAREMTVVAVAIDGGDAVRAVRATRPDVVTMDVNMPVMDGLHATRTIMRECPVPIVVVSSALGDQVTASFRALEAGALAFVRTPPGPGDPRHASAIAELVRTVALMSEVKVVRRRAGSGSPPPRPLDLLSACGDRSSKISIVAIGASTGGPLAMRELLSALPRNFAVPIVAVQHMAAGFVDGFTAWLAEATCHPVQIASDRALLLPGHVYVAPDGTHLGVDRAGRAVLSDAPPEQGLRPSISHLFRAVRDVYGGEVAAVLLSGMGKDGAEQLLHLRNAGAVTIVQSLDSSIVFGMPGEAVRLDAAMFVMAPAEIGAVLSSRLRTG